MLIKRATDDKVSITMTNEDHIETNAENIIQV